MNKKMYEKKKEFFELKEKLAEFGGAAKVLKEVSKLIETSNDVDILIDLKQYLNEKTREFWKESTPIAKRLCEVNIEMAEIYMKEKGDNR